ncbi:MAG: hypothetical protein D6713_08000 [Deltaproteobacteria bacterium]|nr:MAG: hypothetical protein D6713_08000 [Deltaproteobacteria bacterium]
MKRGSRLSGIFIVSLLFIVVSFVLVTAARAAEEGKKEHRKASGKKRVERQFPVPPPPFSEGIFPCSDCHEDMEVNTERRELEDEHVEISRSFDHAPEQRWCLDCHDPNDRDYLRLASGEKIPFSESYRLCGQCHGDKYRDWKVGVHGKRTGNWNGDKQYLLCAHCHNPHSPRFKPLKPMPPPTPPAEIK